MMKHSPKILKTAALIVAALILLTGLIVWAAIWLLPRYLQRSAMPDYLERNQRFFRVGAVRPGNFNFLELENLSLGNSEQPLLTASAARLTFDYTAHRRFGTPGFLELRLLEAPLEISIRKRDIFINDIPAAEFIRKLTELPPGPDGKPIPLVVEALLRTPGSATPARLNLVMRPEAEAGCFEFAGEWTAAAENPSDPTAVDQGTWKAHWNRTAGEFTVTIQQMLAIPFLQEILLRAGQPDMLAALIQQGRLTGDGRFAARFPSFKVTDLDFTGTLADGLLGWRKLPLKPEKPFTFTLRQGGKGLTVTAPELLIAEPFALPLRQLSIQRPAKSALVEFSAAADLRQAVLRTLEEQFGITGTARQPLERVVAGRWNIADERWELAGTSPAQAASADPLLIDGAGGGKLVFNLKEFALSGSGVGGRGNIESQLRFSNLELRGAPGLFRINDGSFRSASRFGGDDLQGDTLEFNFDKFTADTPLGQYELTRPAGDLNIRKPGKRQFDFFLILRADGGTLLTPAGTLRSGAWQCTFNATRTPGTDFWKLAGIDFAAGHLEAVRHGDRVQLTDTELHGTADIAAGRPVKGHFKIQSDSVSGTAFQMHQARLNFRCGKDANAQEPLWQGELEFARVLLPLRQPRPWEAKNGKLKLAGDNWRQRPETLEFAADFLDFTWLDWQTNWLNSHWLLRFAPDGGVRCNLEFESLRADSPALAQGRGSFGRGIVDATLRRDSAGGLEELEAVIDAGQPAWSWRELHVGGGAVKSKIHYRHGDRPSHRGELSVTHATLLGRYFSVMAPRLATDFSYDRDTGASGRLKFTEGTLASPGGQLEMLGAAMDLPWSAAAPADAAHQGSLTARQVRFNGHDEGALSASLRQFNQAFSAVGELRAAVLNQVPVKFNIQMNLPPQTAGLIMDFEVPRAPLKVPLELNNYFADLDATILKGIFSAVGRLECRADAVRSTGTVVAENSDWQFAGALAEGVSGSAEFSDLAHLVSRPDLPVTAKRFKWREWELTDNNLKLTFNPDQRLAISNWNGKFASGTIRLISPLEFRLQAAPAAALPLAFEVKNLPLSQLFARLGVPEVETQAAVSGKIQTRYSGGGLSFAESSVGFKSPTGEMLKMGALERYVIRMRDPEYQAFALAVLREMRCSAAQFDFTDRNGELAMKIKAEGVPAKPVPFVYQGSGGSSPFRAALPGENGFDGELELIVNLKLNTLNPLEKR